MDEKESPLPVEQIEQDRADSQGGGGNTISPPTPKAPQENQHFYWCFTMNNYTTEQIEQIEQIFAHETDWYIFQEETGETTKVPHLQGTIKLKKKQRMSSLKKWNPKIHWESTRSVSASIEYCTKYETRTGRVYYKGINIPEPIEIEEPYGWQLKVMEIISTKPCKRKINWFWEPNGNIGKTTLCKYLVVKYNAIMLSGKSNDMFHTLSKSQNKKIIIYDIPRSSLNYINYGAIEAIKNGLIYSGKYEGAQLVFNCPHIFIFANEEPNTDQLSNDRWNIIKIE